MRKQGIWYDWARGLVRSWWNKTKYFRLHLYYEVSKRAYQDLRQTWDRPEIDWWEKDEDSVFKTSLCRTDRRTDIVTPWAPDGDNKTQFIRLLLSDQLRSGISRAFLELMFEPKIRQPSSCTTLANLISAHTQDTKRATTSALRKETVNWWQEAGFSVFRLLLRSVMVKQSFEILSRARSMFIPLYTLMN